MDRDNVYHHASPTLPRFNLHLRNRNPDSSIPIHLSLLDAIRDDTRDIVKERILQMNSCNLVDPITKKEYVRVSKPTARKLHAARVTYLMCPENLYPFCEWQPYMVVTSDRMDILFTLLLNQFVAHNCLNTETGKFASFYVEKEEYKKFKGEQS